MKLRLPQSLICALMATCATAVTLPSGAGDIISVNYYNSSFDITDGKTGTVGGVGAAGWTNVHHESGAETIVTEGLKNQQGESTAAKLTTQLNTSMWGNNQVDVNTVEGALLRAYIDLHNYASADNHYYIDFSADFAVSSLTLYFSGDSSEFAPVEINGARYIGAGGVATEIAADATTTWGNRTTDGSKIISANNSFTLGNVVGGSYHVTNVDLVSNNRATLAGFQVKDLTDTVAWNASLNAGETSIGNVEWEKASSAAEEIANAVLTVTAADGGSSLALGEATSYHLIQGASGTLTLTGSNLSIDGLHAKQGATIVLDGSLASTSAPVVNGFGKVVLSSNVAGNSAKAVLKQSGGVQTTLELNQKVVLTAGESSAFAGTLVINNSDTSAYQDGQQQGNDNTTGYDFVLNGSAGTYGTTADISSVNKLVLTGGAGLFYSGSGTTINNLTVAEDSDSKLKIEHMAGTAQLTLAGETSLANNSHLTAFTRWGSRVTFEKLVGNGTLTLQDMVNGNSDYTINSLAGFTGTVQFVGNAANSAKKLLLNSTGSENTTVELNQKVVLNNNETTTFAGDLKIHNTTEAYDFQIGSSGGNTVNLSSVKSIELENGSQVYYDANGGTIRKVMVTAGSATWYTNDMYKPDSADVPNLLTINEAFVDGEKLTFAGKWKSNINVEALTGDGTLRVQSGTAAGTADKTYFAIGSLQGFSGSLEFAQNHVKNGNNFNLLTATVNTGSGHDVTISALTVEDKVSGENSSGAVVNLQGAQHLTVSGAMTVGAASTVNVGTAEKGLNLTVGGALSGGGVLNLAARSEVTLSTVGSPAAKFAGSGTVNASVATAENNHYSFSGQSADNTFSGTLNLTRDSGNHSSNITLSHFTGVLNMKGRLHLNTSSFDAASKIVFDGTGLNNTAGFWTNGETTLSRAVEIIGNNTEFYVGGETTLSGALYGNSDAVLKKLSASTLTLENFTDFHGTYAVNGGTVALKVTEGQEKTISNNITGGATLAATGEGKLILSGNTLGGGLHLSKANADGALVMENAVISGRVNLDGAGSKVMRSGATTTINDAQAFSVVLNDGSLSLEKGSAEEKAVFDLSTSAVAINNGKTLTVKEGAALSAGGIWYGSGTQNGHLVVENGGSASATDRVRIESLTNAGQVQLTGTNDKHIDKFSQSSGGNLLLGSGITLEAEMADNGTIAGSFELQSGSTLNLKQLGAEVTASLKDLTLAENAIMGVYSDNSTEADISVSGTLTSETGAKLNANLTLNNGATLAVADGGLRMGSTLTIAEGAKVSLSDNIISGLNSLTVGNGLTLFSGVDSFTLDGTSYTEDYTSSSASNYFNLAGVNRPWDFVIKYEANTAADGGTVSLWMETPEPATATLSLLALAALAAKRKRK